MRSYVGELRDGAIGSPLRRVGPVYVETCFSTSHSTLVQFSLYVTRQRSMQAVKESKERTFLRWLSTIPEQWVDYARFWEAAILLFVYLRLDKNENSII
jgi:hypothetical protein